MAEKSAEAGSAPAPSTQAPPGVWTPAALKAALVKGTTEEKVALLKKIGILDEAGELAERYKSWGEAEKATRTPEDDED